MSGVFLKEYGDVVNLVKAVPHKEQRGFFTADISWTCVDFTSDWVAVGTDTGWLYLYDRFEEVVKHRLTTQQSDRNPLTKVRLKRSVEYVVAMGTTSGFVSIFRLPAPLAGLSGNLQAFGIRDLHHSAVTSLEWSQNAMKLFSGDEDGVVVCTEIDYATNQSQSYIICKEPHAIVQLSYAHRTLLVATRWRTVLCDPVNAMNVIQVGQKDRKSLGPYGSVFLPGSFQPQEAVIYCARPNLSLWKADMTGTVHLTVIFKTLAANLDEPVGVSLLPEKETKHAANEPASNAHFSQLFVFSRDLILSYFENGIFVVNPRSGQFVCFHAAISKILDIAVQDDEILLLTKPKNGTLRYLAQHAFRTKLPSYLTGVPIPLPLGEIRTGNKTVETISDSSERSSSISATKSLFGVLMKNVIGTVQDGTSMTEATSAGTPETGEEMTGPNNTTPDETVTQDSIPIIRLDPNEILPLRIESKSREKEPAATKVKLQAASSGDTVNPNFDDDIVFKKVKKVKKKTKTRMPPTSDLISISSGDSINHDRSTSPVDPEYQAATRSPRGLSPCRPSDADPQLPSTSKEMLACAAQLPPRSASPVDVSHDLNVPPISPAILPVEMCSSRSLDRLDPAVTDIRSELAMLSDSGDAASCVERQSRNDTVEVGRSLEMKTSNISSVSNFNVKIESQRVCSPEIDSNADLDLVKHCVGSSLESEAIAPIGKDVSDPEEKTEDCKEQVHETSSELDLPIVEDLKAAKAESSTKAENAFADGNQALPSPVDSFTSIYQTTGNTPEEIAPEILNPNPNPATPSHSMTSFNTLAENPIVEIWSEIVAPSSLKCLSLSGKHTWCVDKQDGVHYTTIDKPGKWVKIDQKAAKISVSPNGFILWVLLKNSVYAANRVSAKSPAGSEFREIVRDVRSFSVDDRVAWYSKLNGEVWMQKDLKKDRTSYRSIKVPCEHHITDVVCGRGVVWAITDDLMILVRIGIAKGKEEGIVWEPLKRQNSQLLLSNLSFGSDGFVWMMDVSGRTWFMSEVTATDPHGNGIWWEVVILDSCSSDGIPPSSGRAWSLLPQNLSRSSSWAENIPSGDFVAANAGGEVWVNFGKGQSVYASNGSITGHRWEVSTPSGMLSATKWRRISCCENEGKGMVWLEQSNGDLFCLDLTSSDDRIVEIPPPLFNDPILSLAATCSTLWCVTKSGKMFVRSGMTSHCIQGINWVAVDLSQLGNVKVVHLSVSSHNVWAVDSLGNVYLRIGVKPPSNKCINAAWLEIDRKNLPSGTLLAQIATSPDSCMVWAVDTKKNVYIRAGVTERLPLGTHWIAIPGNSFDSIYASDHYVYGLNAKDDVFMRYGISPTNRFGDFWKRIPGKYRHIAVSGSDDLWAIDRDDRLHRRFTFDLEIASESHRQRVKLLSRCDSADAEWEIIN